MKRMIAILLLLTVFLLCGCKPEPKLLHCDRCGKEITVDGNSNMTEDWIIFCPECEEEAFGDNPVVQPG